MNFERKGLFLESPGSVCKWFGLTHSCPAGTGSLEGGDLLIFTGPQGGGLLPIQGTVRVSSAQPRPRRPPYLSEEAVEILKVYLEHVSQQGYPGGARRIAGGRPPPF